MRHVVVERWSRVGSWLHARDPRVKIAALVAFLILVATSRGFGFQLGCLYAVLLVAVVLAARLPAWRVALRAAAMLPFSLVFAAISGLAGEPWRGVTLLTKSYLSAFAVLILICTTPMPLLLGGLEWFGVPRFLLLIAQFVYRYLFVISEEAQRMRLAAWSRGASVFGLGAHRTRFRAATGALAVLFARSYARAQQVHHAMAARGFQGQLTLLTGLRFGWADAAFLVIAVVLPGLARFALEARGS